MLRMWTSARLLRAMAQLADAALETRRQSDMAAVIAHRALLALAVNAKAKTKTLILLQPAHHVLELIETAVVDVQHAAVAALGKSDGEPERV